MHSPEALILRRCFPVPVTFDNLRAAYTGATYQLFPFGFSVPYMACPNKQAIRQWWTQQIKEVTGALDEMYAVVDGREVRVGTVPSRGEVAVDGDARQRQAVADLLDKADRAGYWARPHEVRLDLQERPISRETVAQAVLIGQQYLERSGDGGAR